ncbi:MAG: methyltransferase domain-containing protein [Cellvibrionaceae bacterium]
MMSDRNFDNLAERFENRIHHGLKGAIRRTIIWRDLLDSIPALKANNHLRVLDIGGGLGHFSIELAKLGHQVTYNDLSINMMEKAKQGALKENVIDQIEWSNHSYQKIITQPDNKFDLILCHAVLEWLEKPEQLIPTLKKHLKASGALSLCYYNPAGFIYRNLICGNFNYLDNIVTSNNAEQSESLPSDQGSLTPQNPCSMEQVSDWLKQSSFSIKTTSGIRVFSDYVLQKRGGNRSEEESLKAELAYSTLEPYKRLGRYLHTIAISE